MSFEAEQLRMDVPAGADLSTTGQYKVISIAGTLALSGKVSIGVLQNKPQSGEMCEIAYMGRMKAYAGGAIAANKGFQVSSGGWITLVQSGQDAKGYVLAAANSGDIVPVVANFVNFVATTSGG